MLAVVHLRQILTGFTSHRLQRTSIVQCFFDLKRPTEGILSVRRLLVRIEHMVVFILEVRLVAAAVRGHERCLVAFEQCVHRLLFLVED